MYYPDSVIEEVNNVSPKEILNFFGLHFDDCSKYYSLPCPIHDGQHKNFKINKVTKKWACFSHNCVKNSDNIGFVVEYRQISFVGAIKLIANIARLDIEGVSSTEGRKLRMKHKLDKYRGKSIPKSVPIKESFKKNSFSVPSNNGINHPIIKGKNIPKDMLDLFGVYYNKNMNRIIFLIKDNHKNIISYKARATTSEQLAVKKFDSPYGYKVNTFYGLWVTAPYIKDKKEIILVEGHWDVLKLFKCGVKNVAGTMLNTLTKEQVQWIKDNDILKVKIACDKDKPWETGDSPGDMLILKAYTLLGDFAEIEVIDYPSYSFKIVDNNKELEVFANIETKIFDKKNKMDNLYKVVARPLKSKKNKYEIYLDIGKNKIDLIDAYDISVQNRKNIKNSVVNVQKYKDPDSLSEEIIEIFF